MLDFLVLYLLALYLWFYVSIFCHEMGHFFAAEAVGCQPYLVKIGMGQKIGQFKLKGTRIEFRLIPGGGVTYIAHLAAHHLKPKLVLMYLCGPLVNGLLLLMLLTTYRSGLIQAPIIAALIVFEFWMLVGNLLPFSTEMYGGTQMSDGGQVISVLFKSRQKLIHTMLGLSRYATVEDPSKTFFNNELEALEILFQGNVELNQRHFERAIERLEPLLYCSRFSIRDRVYVIDLLASIVINYGERRYLDRAEQWSAEALRLASQITTLQGTRGAILVELGQYEAGKALLLPLTEKGNDRLDMAISCCYIAKAEYGLGNQDPVKYWLNRAEKAGAANQILLRIRQELSAI